MESAVAADRAATHGGYPASVLVAGLAIAEELGLRADEARLRLAQAIVMKGRGRASAPRR